MVGSDTPDGTHWRSHTPTTFDHTRGDAGSRIILGGGAGSLIILGGGAGSRVILGGGGD